MSAFRQIGAVSAMGLRSVPARFGTSLVVVVGIAAVVAVLVSALAIANGFTRAAADTGDAGRAIVLGGSTEASSSMSREIALAVQDAPGIRAGEAGVPVASAEALVFVAVTNVNTGLDAFVTLRGVGASAFELRPEVSLVEGRMFERGAHEVVVGRSAQQRLGSLDIGANLSLPNGEWSVVGVFESGGNALQSELMTDAETLLNAYQRNIYNSVTVRLADEQGLSRLAAAIDTDPAITSVDATREDEYYAAVAAPVSQLLTFIAYGIGGIMAFGAVFGALNTMYSAVSTRATEIATLRAMGFGSVPVVVSVLVEALVLAVTGAFVGALVAWLVMDGSTISTMTGITPSQLTFGLEVGLDLTLIGIAFATTIALIGGLFAAVRAARVPVAAALQMV
jgi:putative ABC transport system permease protein